MCSTELTNATNGVLTQLANGVHGVPIQDTWQAVHKVHKCMVCSLSGAHTWPSWKQHVNVWWLTRCGWSGMFMQAQSALVCIKVHTQLCDLHNTNLKPCSVSSEQLDTASKSIHGTTRNICSSSFYGNKAFSCVHACVKLCAYWPPWLQRLLVRQAWNELAWNEQAKEGNLYCYKLPTDTNQCCGNGSW